MNRKRHDDMRKHINLVIGVDDCSDLEEDDISTLADIAAQLSDHICDLRGWPRDGEEVPSCPVCEHHIREVPGKKGYVLCQCEKRTRTTIRRPEE